MKILIACEFSGVVRRVFRDLGHEAYSCDIIPAEDSQQFHIQDDAIKVAYENQWDMMIAHPPCDHLAVAGARWFPKKIADGSQQKAIDFFMKLMYAPIPRICLENPKSIMSTKYRKPDQIIHPWQFGHPEKKLTCLWLKNLPLLVPTLIVDKFYRTNKIHMMPDSKSRKKERSRTFEGIAMAMGTQWTN